LFMTGTARHERVTSGSSSKTSSNGCSSAVLPARTADRMSTATRSTLQPDSWPSQPDPPELGAIITKPNSITCAMSAEVRQRVPANRAKRRPV
jgi:hypothetical protein